ncbi:hypothetical protein LX59_00193 [Azomonas agilis]|uniref:Uncharacterized protein n=1 Tax=Azomonas agilis TaxID=116849 RepID=A0A562J2B7_9GAMM|nr:hypothetical protein [Azomonas agilis]TWH77287.1 hypothetical protein LX59_00193 [Azomonas agilis]
MLGLKPQSAAGRDNTCNHADRPCWIVDIRKLKFGIHALIGCVGKLSGDRYTPLIR